METTRLLTRSEIEEKLARMAKHPLMEEVESLEIEAHRHILIAREIDGLTRRFNLWQVGKLFAEIGRLRKKIESETI